MTRKCVFCGGAPVTAEHAWPAWLQPHLTTPGTVVSRRWGTAENMTGVETPKPDVKVRRVCITCNNGWMSDLEGKAKDVLLPMVQGQVQRLGYSDQQLVATWAIKTAMMLQFTPVYEAGPAIHPRLYRELYAQRDQPPASVVVWLGREAQAPPGGLFRIRPMMIEHRDMSGLVPVRTPYLGFEATMVARHLVLAVMGHAGPAQVNVLDEAAPPPALERIWPVRASRGVLLPERRGA